MLSRRFAMEGKVFLCRYLIWLLILLGQLHGHKSCIEKERRAFLELKKYLTSQTGYTGPNLVSNTWTNDTKSDCCRWDGVECSPTSGRVTKIAFVEPDFFFKGRVLLNLSLLHPFEEVRSLDLSDFGYGGFFDDVEGYQSLKRLRNLEILNLDYNWFNYSIFPFLNAATSLTALSLVNNFMEGSFPAKELKDLRNLEILQLGENLFNGSIPLQELSALRNLKALGLSDNDFSGSKGLQGICKFRHLQELDISYNRLAGQFPSCLTSLTSLRVLELSGNQMTGKLPSTLGNLESLELISLSYNNFEGSFSLGWLANLSKLKVFRLNSISNSLQVEWEGFWKPKFQLTLISLRNCKLKKVPHFLLYQKDLRHVDLSGNNISGNFPTWLLENNTKLEALFLQNNSFTTFQLPEYKHSLLYLDVSINEFDHLFPENIGWTLPHLRYMNIAYNGFQGTVPSSLGNMKMIKYLSMSVNRFHGEILPDAANFTDIEVLYMDNNQFSGKIGQGLRNAGDLLTLDVSNNNLSGVIPSWIGELESLRTLLLSNNSLEGEIPISLFSISTLQLLDLSTNTLYGDLPPRISASQYPAILLLQDNNLSGRIPHTLLANVQILDLRNNRLFGNVPEFIDTELINILLLSGNDLTGHIPRNLCSLRNISLVDLSNNRLSGSIPSCLSNTSFGMGREDDVIDSYDPGFTSSVINVTYFRSLLLIVRFQMRYRVSRQTEIEFATKHRYDAYMGKNLGFLRGMDLSRNELIGDIPEELDGLMKLNALNLSSNKLSGTIPKIFSGMKNLESLDLSFNRLQGHIPPELTDLKSLEVFNVSYNNLSGVIPQGKQFNTFDTPSYLGNPLLCGKPTDTSCASNNSLQEPINEVSDDESIIDMVSFYWSCGAAYVVLLLGTLVLLSFDSPVSRAWFYFVDVSVHKVRRRFF